MNKVHALGLPPSSVRALLAIMLVGGVLAAAFYDMPEGKFAALVGLAGAAIGYYFGSKAGAEKQP